MRLCAPASALQDGSPRLPQVYNITPYLKYHPGGEKILLSVAGKDGTPAFDRYHRWVNAPALIGRLVVGVLPETRRTAEEL